MLGWIFDIDILKSILPMWITMKFSTAFCFFLSGIIIYSIVSLQEKESDIARIVLPVTTLVVILIMGTFFVSSLPGMELGIEDIFVKETKGSASGFIPGRPAVPTMVAFILVAIAGLLAPLKMARARHRLVYIGRIVLGLGGLAVLGYISNMPLLRYDIKGWSNPMACHTAILFTLIGISLILLSDKRQVNH